MNSIISNTRRIGNFTNSEIYRLLGINSAKATERNKAMTYIAEKNKERRLQRSLNSESQSKSIIWGKELEPYVFEHYLGLDYSYNSQQTIMHPDHVFWAGSPDGFFYNEDGSKEVIDVKCPYTLNSFCDLVDGIYTLENATPLDYVKYFRENHKDGDKYYWQLVGGACISNSYYARLIVFAPYEDELPQIKNSTLEKSIIYANDDELPHLSRNGIYANLNVIRFEVPKEDKELLTNCVIAASKHLINNHKKQI